MSVSLSLIDVSMRMLCTALLPAPCACAAAVRSSSIAIFGAVWGLSGVVIMLWLLSLWCFGVGVSVV